MALMSIYCYGHEGVPFIDFHKRYHHEPGEKVLRTLPEVVEMLMEREGMSRRSAYDYAKTIERIQFLTR
jgi:hypothetical protein